MKLQQLVLAAVLAAFSYTAAAEDAAFVGAGNGGPLLSSNGGCVKSQNMGKEFPECMGEKKAEPEAPPPAEKPKAEKPKQKVVVIRDCARCNAAKKSGKAVAKPKAKVVKKVKAGKKPPKLKPKAKKR